jgi:hypothetical protein
VSAPRWPPRTERQPQERPDEPPGGGERGDGERHGKDGDQHREAQRGGQHDVAAAAPLRLCGQVRHEPAELAVGPRPERRVQPVLQLAGLEPALDGGPVQPVHDRVAVGIRCPQ